MEEKNYVQQKPISLRLLWEASGLSELGDLPGPEFLAEWAIFMNWMWTESGNGDDFEAQWDAEDVDNFLSKMTINTHGPIWLAFILQHGFIAKTGDCSDGLTHKRDNDDRFPAVCSKCEKNIKWDCDKEAYVLDEFKPFLVTFTVNSLDDAMSFAQAETDLGCESYAVRKTMRENGIIFGADGVPFMQK